MKSRFRGLEVTLNQLEVKYFRERPQAFVSPARVVSMPSWELFDAQEPAYQQSVLPPAVTARVTVEEASPIGWERYAGPCGVVLGMRSFGMSAPMKIVAEHFGFNADHVVAAAKSAMRRAAGGTTQDDLIRS